MQYASIDKYYDKHTLIHILIIYNTMHLQFTYIMIDVRYILIHILIHIFTSTMYTKCRHIDSILYILKHKNLPLQKSDLPIFVQQQQLDLAISEY